MGTSADTSLAQARFLGLAELAMPASGPTVFHNRLAAALCPLVASAFVASDGLAPDEVSADDIAVLLAKEARAAQYVATAPHSVLTESDCCAPNRLPTASA